MKKLVFCIAFLMAGCVATPIPDSSQTARQYIGLDEYQDRSELRDLTGVDPVRTEWCAAFVNAILELDGIPGSASVSDHPLMARSFLDWGVAIERENVKRGDVIVFPRGNRGWQGHVGFYVGESPKGNWIILGGNQDNEVSYGIFNPNKALGIRRYPINTTSPTRTLWGFNPVDLERQGENKWEDH